jgi:putative 4-mercaptohistidine N1-methyltranferase
MNPYETDKLVSEYLLFHYGSEGEMIGKIPAPREALQFPRRTVGDLIGPMGREARALDVGCAVGRASFELARYAQEVIGIDFSHRFIAAALDLKAVGAVESSYPVEGRITALFRAEVPGGINRNRVQFETGDAMALREDLGEFDVVLAANLICRLPDPQRFLDRLPQLVKPGGQLLLTTPFTWLEEFTPPENWLGGRDANDVRSFDALKALLEPNFELQLSKDMPFLIREHARKFQYGVALGTRWRRRLGE